MATFNPKLPDDGVNLSEESPLRDLALLLGGVLGIVLATVLVVGLVLDVLVPKVPVSVEQALFSSLKEVFDFEKRAKESDADPALLERRASQRETLKRLTGELSREWPEGGYEFSIELVDFGKGIGRGRGPNAAAFPGGLILVNPALMDQVESENELAMVLGHELGHFRNRDHLRGLGRGVALQLILAGLGTTGGAAAIGEVAGFAGVLVEGRFSRGQESEADRFGLELVARRYGHVGGSAHFFERMLEREEATDFGAGAFLRSHPLSRERIRELHRISVERGWEFSEELVPVRWSQKETEPKGAPSPPSPQ